MSFASQIMKKLLQISMCILNYELYLFKLLFLQKCKFTSFDKETFALYYNDSWNLT